MIQVMSKMVSFMDTMAIMQEAVLILCQENNKNEKLKECTNKIRS